MVVPKSFFTSESAVSESIGYILISGIMVAAIGIILIIGYPALQNWIGDGHMQNMERGFVVLGNNIDRIMSQDAQMQSVELNLNGGSIMTTDTGTFDISYKYLNTTTNIVETKSENWDMTNIIYNYHGNRHIGYEFGGVVENMGSDGYVLSEPNFVVGDPFIIPITNIYGGSNAIGGDGVAKITIYGRRAAINTTSNVHQIDVSVKSDYYKAWESYLKQLGMTTSVDDSLKVARGSYNAVSALKPNGIEVIENRRYIAIYIVG
jgi:hypothetical protein